MKNLATFNLADLSATNNKPNCSLFKSVVDQVWKNTSHKIDNLIIQTCKRVLINGAAKVTNAKCGDFLSFVKIYGGG